MGSCGFPECDNYGPHVHLQTSPTLADALEGWAAATERIGLLEADLEGSKKGFHAQSEKNEELHTRFVSAHLQKGEAIKLLEEILREEWGFSIDDYQGWKKRLETLKQPEDQSESPQKCVSCGEAIEPAADVFCGPCARED